MKPVLVVEGLTKLYGPGCPRCLQETGPSRGNNRCPACGTIVACADVSFRVMPGEVLGVVGESGSGKSTVLRCLCLEERPDAGHAFLSSWEGDILSAPPQERRRLRDFRIGMVHQNPHLGLLLDVTAGGNIAERLLAAGWRNVGSMRARAGELLERTEVSLDRMDDLPRYFSGGMQQRVQIAKALANSPELLLMDELTTGLDVSVQAQILDLCIDIQRSNGVAMVLVSHDMAVIRMMTHRTLVMKDGRVVEEGLTDQLLEDPQHEYTQLLVSCVS